MDKHEREEVRRRVENFDFLQKTFDYDERGWLVWREDRGTNVKAGDRAGSFKERSGGNVIGLAGVWFYVRRLVWIRHGRSIPLGHVVGVKGSDSADDRIENLALKPRKEAVRRAKAVEPDAAHLRSLFTYDPETGILAWRVARGKAKVGRPVTCESVGVEGVRYKTHRLAFVIHHGRPVGDGLMVDHVNGNPRDNRVVNLREATRAQNNMNARRYHGRSNDLPKGVHRSGEKFMAQITVRGRNVYLGTFATAAEAADAYAAAARLHFGEHACLDR